MLFLLIFISIIVGAVLFGTTTSRFTGLYLKTPSIGVIKTIGLGLRAQTLGKKHLF